MYTFLICIISTSCINFCESHNNLEAKDMAYSWTEAYYNVDLDHFAYTNAIKFPLRFLYNNSYHKPGGPIFFYTGNEGPIDEFASDTGIMWDLAQLLNASIVFAEHRYYGKSYPFGQNESFSNLSTIGYLSSLQVLADWSELIPYLKSNIVNCTQNCNVIIFGGSYGGMLAAWFRMKYPMITAGAWASSAPVLLFKNGGPSLGAYFNVTSRTFLKSGCQPENIISAFQAIDRLSGNETGLKLLNDVFKVNSSFPITSKNDVDLFLKPWIRWAFESLVELDYPYPANFLAPLPKWPVREACKILGKNSNTTSDEDLMKNLFDAITIYYGNQSSYCVRSDVFDYFKFDCPDPGYWSDFAWMWQKCTEIVLEYHCSFGWPNDVFWPSCNESNVLDGIKNNCMGLFNYTGYNTTMLRENGIEELYGFDFSQAENIIFTNGDLDVWSSGGVTNDTPGIKNANNRGIYNYLIRGSAHHLDLRQPNTCDQSSVIHARYQIVQILMCWAYPSRPECSQPYQQQPIPDFEEVNVTDCKPRVFEYPWGVQPQNPTPSNSQTDKVHILVFIFILSIIFYTFY